MYYVYVIMNERNEMYIGYTSDLENRLKAHNEGRNKSTKNRKWEYVYYEAYKSIEDAKDRERKLKQGGQSKRRLWERIERSIEKSKR